MSCAFATTINQLSLSGRDAIESKGFTINSYFGVMLYPMSHPIRRQSKHTFNFILLLLIVLCKLMLL
jgi:hypothetical protein